MIQNIKDFIYTITRSSQDPTKLALTFRGLIVAAIPILVSIAPVICSLHLICIDPTQIPTTANTFVTAIDDILKACASIMIVWGLARKFYSGVWNHPDVVVE